MRVDSYKRSWAIACLLGAVLFGAPVCAESFSEIRRSHFVGPIDLRVTLNSSPLKIRMEEQAQTREAMHIQADMGKVRLEMDTRFMEGAGTLPGTLALEYQPELIPAFNRDIPRGEKIFTGRQVFRIRHAISNSFRLSLEDNPIFHMYYWPDGVEAKGVKEARAVENEIVLVPEISILNKLFLIHVPVFFQQVGFVRFQDGDRIDDRWEYILRCSPSLTFNFAPESFLSVVYESRNFVAPNLANLNLDFGWREGNVRAFLRFGI